MGFLVGLLAGAVSVAYFRPIAKTAVKGGIRFVRAVQEVQAEVAEDLADLKAEAEADLRAEEHKPAPHKREKPVH